MALYPMDLLVDHVQGSDLRRINALLQDFSPTSAPLTLPELQEILETSHMVVLRDGRKAIVGMATLVIYRKPTGRVGIVEDVVVATQCRGRGGGRELMKCLMAYARQMNLKHVELTSNPTRLEARALYESLGFKPRDTTCYRRKF